MANETFALRGEPQQNQVAGHVAENDYQSFSAALGASARGRAFLHEYARRNRHADTEVVLAALDRLESVARSQKTAPEAERIRQDLRALLDTIHSARPQIDSTPGAIKAATLAALIEFVQARIEALVQPTNAPIASVPEPEQPELPIPQPGSAAQRTIALVQAIAPLPIPAPEPVAARVDAAARHSDLGVGLFEPARSTKIIPEVNFIDSLFDEIDAKAKAPENSELLVLSPPVVTETPAAPAAVLPPVDASDAETHLAAITPAVVSSEVVMVTEAPVAVVPGPATSYLADAVSKSAAADASQHAMNNALAAIMALSEEERLAMFT
jgi:hypothetical protein